VSKPRLPVVKMMLWFPCALVLMGVGLPLCLMPMIFPLGIVLIILAAVPYARWLSQKIHADMAYADRDHTTNDGEEMPWFETEETVGMSDDEMINIILNKQGRGK
jgi:hypothetical protein